MRPDVPRSGVRVVWGRPHLRRQSCTDRIDPDPRCPVPNRRTRRAAGSTKPPSIAERCGRAHRAFTRPRASRFGPSSPVLDLISVVISSSLPRSGPSPMTGLRPPRVHPHREHPHHVRDPPDDHRHPLNTVPGHSGVCLGGSSEGIPESHGAAMRCDRKNLSISSRAGSPGSADRAVIVK